MAIDSKMNLANKYTDCQEACITLLVRRCTLDDDWRAVEELTLVPDVITAAVVGRKAGRSR